MSIFLIDPDGHNKRFIDAARNAAKEGGEGVVVFVGSMAVLSTHKVDSAKDEARRWSVNNPGGVKIKRIKV